MKHAKKNSLNDSVKNYEFHFAMQNEDGTFEKIAKLEDIKTCDPFEDNDCDECEDKQNVITLANDEDAYSFIKTLIDNDYVVTVSLSTFNDEWIDIKYKEA